DHARALLDKTNDPEARYALYNNSAVTLIGLRQFDKARDLLRDAARMAPARYEAHVTLSQLYREQKKLDDALAELDRGLARARALHDRRELDAGTLVLLYYARYRLHVERKDSRAALADLDAVL